MHIKTSLKLYYKKLHTNKYIVAFAKKVEAKNLWHFTKFSVVWGITIGVMCSWIPMPFHTTIAVIIAILVDCNIPLVVVSIWISNPITMPFMYYIAYRLGEAIMHLQPSSMAFHPSIKDLMAAFEHIWEPLLLGCFICSIFCGFVTYGVLNFIWASPRLKRTLISRL